MLVLNIFRNTFRTIAISVASSFFNLSDSSRKTEIKQLEKKNLNYRLKLAQYQNLAKENKVLREALNFKNKDNLNLIGAEITAFSPSSWQQYVFLNSGQDKNIKEGMLVIDKNGNLIGKIKEVYKNRSKMILIKNSDFQTPVSINGQTLGLLQGTLSGVEILYVEKSHQIEVAEPVYAAITPAASYIKIGKISKIKKNEDDLFYEINVELFSTKKLPQIVFILK